jgi:hypothetical protein
MNPAVEATNVPGKPVSIFLSYAHEDDDIVTAFQAALERLGKEVGQNLRVFRDRTSILPGISISKEIQDNLRASDYLVVFYMGSLRQNVSWSGVEVGFFQALIGEDVRRDGKTERKIVSIYLLEAPPSLTDIKGIPLGIETSALSLPREEYIRSISQHHASDGDEPLAEFLRAVALLAESRQVGTDPTRADRQRTARENAINNEIIPAIRTAMYDSLGSRVARRSIEQNLIEFRLEPGSLRDRSEVIPPDAELQEHGGAFALFKLAQDDTTISWRDFKKHLGEVVRDEALIIIRAMERVFDTAISTSTIVDNDQLVRAPADGKLYRVLVTRHFDYYNGKKIVNMYFIEKLKRYELGSEDTTVVLAFLNVAARYRSIFLEAESEISEDAFRVQGDPQKMKEMVDKMVKEIIMIEDDSIQLGLDSMKAKVILFGKGAALDPAKQATLDWFAARASLVAAAARVHEAKPDSPEFAQVVEQKWMPVLKSFTEFAKRLNADVAHRALEKLSGFFKD